MLLNKFLTGFVLCTISLALMGCGGNDPEVFDAPASEEPELTEEEVEGEMEYTGQK